MKEYLLQHDGRYIECEVDGCKLIYTCSDDPRCHYEETLRDETSYIKLKNKVKDIYNSCRSTSDAYWSICDFLQSNNDFFTDDMGVLHRDLRDIDAIVAYENEAFDKVWLMRSRPGVCPDEVARILDRYDDIPKTGYSTWECGYWNGILGALRWVMGDEKDFLDT